MPNYYSMLNLNSTGLNKDGLAYSPKEITVAYRSQALLCHPDKNPGDASAVDQFAMLNQAYELLMNPEDRRVFDRELSENPEAFEEAEHLFFDMEASVAGVGSAVDSTALVKYGPKVSSVDLTRLITNADNDAASLLKLAAENTQFAMAVVGNPGLFSTLKISEQFQLVMQLDHSLVQANQLVRIKQLWARSTVKVMLERLAAQQEPYQLGLIGAGWAKKELLHEFYMRHPEILTHLSMSHLLTLAQVEFSAAIALVTRYANTIRIQDVEFLLDKYPEQNAELLAVYSSNIKATHATFEQYQAIKARVLAEGVEVLATTEVQALIPAFGMSAFNWAKTLEPGFALDANILIFDTLIKNLPLASFEAKYAQVDQAQLHLILVNKLKRTLWSKKYAEVASYVSSPILAHLLDNASYEGFEASLAEISGAIKRAEDPVPWENYLMYHGQGDDGAESPFFLRLLLDSNPEAQIRLFRNTKVLLMVLANPQYVEALMALEAPKKNLARACSRLLPEEFDATRFPAEFSEAVEAHRTLASFQKTTENKTDPGISYKEFLPLVEKTGFFLELLDLNIKDPEVKCQVVCLAEPYLKGKDDWSAGHKLIFNEWLNETVTVEHPEILTKVLDTYAAHHSATIMSNMDGSSKLEVSRLLSLIVFMSANPAWQRAYFTGQVLSGLNKQLKSAEFKERALRGFDNYGIEEKEYNATIRTVMGPMVLLMYPSTAEIEAGFEKLMRHFNTEWKDKYPYSAFHAYEVLKGEHHQKLIKTYFDLEMNVDCLKWYKLADINADQCFENILSFLKVTGFYLPSFEAMKDTLKNKPEPLSVLATLIIQSDEFKLIPEMHEELVKHQIAEADLYAMSLKYTALAKHYIYKYRHSITGTELAAFVKAHGELIMPMIESYGLDIKLNNGQKLVECMDKVRVSDHGFKNIAVDIEQIVDSLRAAFDVLVKESLLYAPNPDNKQKLVALQAEMAATVKKNKIRDAGLNALLDSMAAHHSLMPCVITLALKGDATCRSVLQQSYRLGHLAADIKRVSEQLLFSHESCATVKFSAAKDTLGEALLHEVVLSYLANTADPALINVRIYEYFELGGKLNVKTLNAHKEVAERVLKNILFGPAPEAYTHVVSRLKLLFDDSEHNAVMTWYVAQFKRGQLPQDCLMYLLQGAHGTQTPVSDITGPIVAKLDAKYGVSNRNKILTQYFMARHANFAWPKDEQVESDPCCSLFLNGRLTGTSLSALTADNLERIHHLKNYFNRVEQVSSPLLESSLLELSDTQCSFFPYIEQGVMKVADLTPEFMNSLPGRTLKSLALEGDWTQKLVMLRKKQAIVSFFETDYFRFVQEQVLSVMQKEVDLHTQSKSLHKAQAIAEYRAEIEQIIIDKVTSIDHPQDLENKGQELHRHLLQKLHAIAHQPVINERRRPVQAFFKGLAGVLLSAPLLFVPLAFNQYRGVFFKARTAVAMEAIEYKLSERVRRQSCVKGGPLAAG